MRHVTSPATADQNLSQDVLAFFKKDNTQLWISLGTGNRTKKARSSTTNNYDVVHHEAKIRLILCLGREIVPFPVCSISNNWLFLQRNILYMNLREALEEALEALWQALQETLEASEEALE